MFRRCAWNEIGSRGRKTKRWTWKKNRKNPVHRGVQAQPIQRKTEFQPAKRIGEKRHLLAFQTTHLSQPTAWRKNEEPAAELVGAEQNSSPAPSAYSSGNSWSSPKTDDVSSPEAIVMPDIISVTPVQESVPVEVPATVSAPAPVPAAPAEVSAPSNNSWMSVAPSPWDAEVAKASKLAATWDTAVAVATEPTPTATVIHETVPDPTPEQVAAALPAEAVEEIREEAAHVVEQAAPVVPQRRRHKWLRFPGRMWMIMVAKVLARMDPSVFQAMTKELMKPVIESIVREELNKK